MDVFLIGSIVKGKIVFIPIDKLVIYIIIFIVFIVFIVSTLNLLLKHSQFNKKLKIFSMIQVLIIIPVMIMYWIVSVEIKDFYLRDLDINQWSAIFNNMIIYFATCIIGIMSIYNEKIKKKNRLSSIKLNLLCIL